MAGAQGVRMATGEAVVRYRVDAGASRFTVKAFASGLFSAIGHNPTMAIREFSGEAGFVADSLDRAFLRVTARADSLEVTDDVSQKDKLEIESRTKQEVLETDTYPEIAFESSSISATKIGDDRYAVNIKGELTLHGLTCSQTIIAQVAINGETFRASGEFSLRQTDYGIRLFSLAAGTLKVKDELKLAFDFVARKQG